MRNLIVILGDQLNERISSLEHFDKAQDHILMAEVWEEATYVKHHQKKIAFIFSAMRHFSNELANNGYEVKYQSLDDNKDSSFESVLQNFMSINKPEKIIVTSPSEYRVLDKVKSWSKMLSTEIEVREDTRFLCSKNEFQQWACGRKSLVMEYFYREMRKKYNILLENDKPIGGKWNFDKENRKALPSSQEIPDIIGFTPDPITLDVLALVADGFPTHFGNTDNFHYAVTRNDALKALDSFITHQLPYFGDYQDAMVEGKPWLYHSILSHYINIGLLLPMDCIEAAINAYENDTAPINAVEGYIRQIIGWREYVNGIYWLKMPDYQSQNYLDAKATLPEFFWDGDTDLNCLKQCIQETQNNAYAHHIQRLMVLGNFCLLLGVNPKHVNEWYLIVYADAYEWVEMPNVTGMILYADGGLLGSKPYAASGSYINKMSNYCKNCRYKVKEKLGPDACPFNYLYWHFIDKNKSILKDNQRMKMIYNTFNKMDIDKIKEIRINAQHFIERIYQ